MRNITCHFNGRAAEEREARHVEPDVSTGALPVHQSGDREKDPVQTGAPFAGSLLWLDGKTHNLAKLWPKVSLAREYALPILYEEKV